MEVYEQEIFGPARNVVRVDSLEEAITLINKHELGNGVTIFTNDGLAARKFTTEIDVGMVGVNVPIQFPLAIITLLALKALVLVRAYVWTRSSTFLYKTKTISERWMAGNASAASTFAFPSNND